MASDALIANAQSLLDQVKTDLNLTQGEVTMFIPDMPNVPPQDAPVMIAQANQAQPSDVTTTRTLGVCYPAPSEEYNGDNTLSPMASAQTYFFYYENQTFKQQNIAAKVKTHSATVTVLQQPKHGILRLVTEADRGTLFNGTHGPLDPATAAAAAYYAYLPEKGYGKDSATLLVDFGGGLKVKVVYFFKQHEGPLGNTGWEDVCEKTGTQWKISSTLDANGTTTITSVEYQSPATSDAGTTVADTATLASTLGSTLLSNLAGEATGVTVNLADLPGAAVGQTTGSNITLDTNASGYGWFIDTTPADNSEFLPTSNPNEWVAKAGSDAAGKMDMLSVLLHEYGHALGINHSADPADYMGATLTAGVRRLPSADEMALMQQLIGQAKATLSPSPSPASGGGEFPTVPLGTSFIGFLGLLRGSRYGGVSIAPDASTLVTQYDWAANPTLTNGSLISAAGWSTQGSVNIGNGAAVMNEVTASQTRLSQVFLLNPSDRTLSFTLAGTALDNLTGAPDDAFEVALLDANTGASLLGSDGLTRTDAFLNLQADGTQNMANCVTCTTNADGSRTYHVDLSSVLSTQSSALGLAANLSFDLIGFGQNGSHVTVRDVNLNGASGLQHLHDDTATILEDSSLAFDPYAQVAGVAGSYAASLVNAPAHGVVSVNADGTFSYTPQADYNGADSFTYRLSDGAAQTNLATVSITLTPVNDAPVVADVQASTAEDTALVIALGAYATDVDSATLTTQIVTDPAHGVLTQNADGSYTYTPNANYNGADSFTYQANDGALNSNLATVSLNVTPVNDAPTLGNLNLAAVEDTALTMNLLTAASDVDGDVLTAALVAGAQHGQVNINADGSFTYTPSLNYNGADSFTYKVNDGSLDSNIATVMLTIAAVNDAPVAADAAVAATEDTALVIDLYV